jgi:hypothetical protein
MLRAGEFGSITSLGERESDVLQAIARTNENDFSSSDEAIQNLVELGLIEASPFRGFALTMRGQLVHANQRARRTQHRNKVAQMLKRFRWAAD